MSAFLDGRRRRLNDSTTGALIVVVLAIIGTAITNLLHRACHHRLFGLLVALLFGAAALAVSGTGLVLAQVDDRLVFIEDEPVKFDLGKSLGDKKTVEVVNGDTQILKRLELRVVGLPTGVVVAEESPQTELQPGAVARFTLIRQGEAASAAEGRLVAVGSNGAVARRAVTLTTPSTPPKDDLDEVILTAWRLWPFGDQFKIDDIEVEGLGNSASGNNQVGFVSTEGDVARVTLQGETFSATDLGQVGEYTGKVDLRPNEDGGDLTVKVRAKDAWIWPLAVLVIGLGLVSLINQYRRYYRPGDYLSIGLARLLSAATQQQAASLEYLRRIVPKFAPELDPAVYRIRRQGNERPLLLDSEVETALADWSKAVDENERKPLLPGGDRWKLLKGYVETYTDLLHQVKKIADRTAYLCDQAGPECSQLTKGEALKDTLSMLRPDPSGLANDSGLREAKQRADDQLARLGILAKIQGMLLSIKRHCPDLNDEADRQLRLLWHASGDLTEEKDQAETLYEQAHAQGPVPEPHLDPFTPTKPVGADAVRADEAASLPSPNVPKQARKALVAVVLVALVLVIAGTSVVLSQFGKERSLQATTATTVTGGGPGGGGPEPGNQADPVSSREG